LFQTLPDLEKDLDNLLLLEKQEATDLQGAPISDQDNSKSGNGGLTSPDSSLTLTIRSTPEGRIVYWRDRKLHSQTRSNPNQKIDELPFQEGTTLVLSEGEETRGTRDLL